MRLISFMILMVFLQHPVYGQGQPVFDATAVANLREVINGTTQTINKLQDMNTQLSAMKNVLGAPLSANGENGLPQNVLQFKSHLESLSQASLDPLSHMSIFSNLQGEQNQFAILSNLQALAKGRLFPDGAQPLSLSKHEEIRGERLHILQESSLLSVALAGQQKASLKTALEHINHVGQAAVQPATLYDALAKTNHLLSLILVELAQHRALTAQLLELQGARVANTLPIAFKGPKVNMDERGQ